MKNEKKTGVVVVSHRKIGVAQWKKMKKIRANHRKIETFLGVTKNSIRRVHQEQFIPF